MIPALNPWGLPDFAAGAGQPQVEFVILVSHQVFIEQSNAFKNLSIEEATKDGVGRTFVIRVMPTRSADGKGAMMSGGDCPLDPVISFIYHGPTNVISPRGLGYFQAADQVVGRVTAVRVHPGDPTSMRCTNSTVHRTGRYPQWIVD